MPHPLDRPVWSALTTRQAQLAQGDGSAVRLAADYGLFAAAADASPEALAALAALLPAAGEIALVETQIAPPVPGAAASPAPALWQMTAQALTPAPAPTFEITPLTQVDAPRMLALATLTQPGPFFARTHELGDFVGVKADGVLVAMAGERIKLPGFTEVSGVCTHPDHRGRGYAEGLSRHVAAAILARGETAFLHSYASNVAAIALYQSLGFTLRREMTMTLLMRASPCARS